MASNKDKMVKKLGSEEAYKAYMRELAGKPHKRGGRSNLARQIEVKAEEAGVSTEVYVKRIMK